MLDRLAGNDFLVSFQSHAAAILQVDFPEAVEEIERAVISVEIPITEIIGSGGGESQGTQRLRRSLAHMGWRKHSFEIRKIVDGVEKEALSHEIDHVKNFSSGVIALEIEWNNKDPFFDRDLENFKRLHGEGAISAGVIVTRGAALHESMRDFVLRFARDHAVASFDDLARLGVNPIQRQREQINRRVSRDRNPAVFADAWSDQFVSDKFGEATTHWRKLLIRVQRGVGNPCPLLLIGLPASIVRFPETTSTERAADEIRRAVIAAEENNFQ